MGKGGLDHLVLSGCLGTGTQTPSRSWGSPGKARRPGPRPLKWRQSGEGASGPLSFQSAPLIPLRHHSDLRLTPVNTGPLSAAPNSPPITSASP